MDLRFHCACGTLVQVAAELGGQQVRCPSCRQIVTAPPEPEEIAPPPQAELPPAPELPEDEHLPMLPAFCPAGIVGLAVAVMSAVGGWATGFWVLSWFVGGLLAFSISCGTLRRIRRSGGVLRGRGWARAALLLSLIEILSPFALGIWAIAWAQDMVNEMQRGLR